jgi:DNA-binding beta-propeller fold protein YncE/phage FluMu protein Com
MPISLTCPKCSGKLRVADKLAGKKIKCPKCAALVPVAAPEDTAIAAAVPPAEPEGIATAISAHEEIADEQLTKPRKAARNIRRDPATEAVSTLIPYKNGRALLAYYLGVFSFIPCVGLILGPAALILGILGIRFVKANPTAKGTGHALAGIIMGSLTTLGYWGLTAAMLVMGGLAALTGSRSTTVGGPVAIASNNPQQPGNNPVDPPAQEVNLGQALFASDRDLVDPNRKLNLAAEPGRMAALRMGAEVRALAFSADGKTLAIATPSQVQLWDLQRGQSRTISSMIPQSLAFSPDGTRLAVGGKRPGKAVIELFHTQTLAPEKTLFEGPQDQIPERLAFSADGSLFVAPAHPTINVWETATWQRRPHAVNDAELAQILGFAFDRDTKTLAVAVKSAVLLLDPATMKEQSRLKAGQIGTAAVALSHDGKMVATGAFWGDIDLFDVAQGKFVRRLGRQGGRVHSLTFTPDDRMVVSAGTMDGQIKLIEVATGKEAASRRADAPGKQLTSFAVSPDGRTLLTGSNGGILKVWDVAQLRGPAK